MESLYIAYLKFADCLLTPHGVLNGPLVKWPKTPASHAGNTSSNLVRVTIFK